MLIVIHQQEFNRHIHVLFYAIFQQKYKKLK